MENVEVEYIPEKPELEDRFDEEFRKIFEKFSFSETAQLEVHVSRYLQKVCSYCDLKLLINIFHVQENEDKKEDAQNAATKNKNDSDSEEEEQNNEQKERGLSNKKKKVIVRL